MTNLLDLFIKEKLIGKTVNIGIASYQATIKREIIDVIYDNDHAVALYTKGDNKREDLIFLNQIETIHFNLELDETKEKDKTRDEGIYNDF